MPIHKFLLSSLIAFVVLSCAMSGQTFNVLHEFAAPPTDGAPSTPLSLGPQGQLFFASNIGGTSTDCGSTGCGGVFDLSKGYSRWKENSLFAFDLVNGYSINPTGFMAFDSSGNIFGTQTGGSGSTCNCGTVYELSQTGGVWSQTVLYSFTGGVSDGMYPLGLIRDSAGNLYGSTAYGGSGNNGVIFELTPTAEGSWNYNVIHNFSYGVNGSSDGSNPQGPLTTDLLGNIYGSTIGGGLWGYGTVFRLSPSNGSWTETVLFNFTVDYGSAPQPWAVIPDSSGNLYGTTVTGGAYALGTIYKLTPARGFWNRTILHTFTGSGDGGYPSGALAIDANGTLYGATQLGGSFGYGNVYKFSHLSGRWTQTSLHEFTNGSDGRQPDFGVIRDWKGNVYGIANGGGAYGYGVAFEITP